MLALLLTTLAISGNPCHLMQTARPCPGSIGMEMGMYFAEFLPLLSVDSFVPSVADDHACNTIRADQERGWARQAEFSTSMGIHGHL